MQSIDTHNADSEPPAGVKQTLEVGPIEAFPQGSRKTIDLPAGRELALFNINGEFYAIENFCPHKGAPLVEGILCEHVIECDWHGWQFDVRTGECLTVTEKIATYEVAVEDGVVKILV